MPKRPDFQPFQRGDRWLVSIPPSMSATGHRIRKSFSSPTAAEKFAATLRAKHNTGARGSVISAALASQAVEAARLLEGSGISIVEAAKMMAAKIKKDGGNELFSERYDRAIVANEGEWSEKYMLDMERLPRLLPEWFMDTPCGLIDRETMVRALIESGPKAQSTLDARCRYLFSIVNHRPRHKKADTITILTVSRCARLLRACQSKEELRAVALLLFAGIRPDAEFGEIRRLDWSDVGKKEIYISPETSKVGDRHIPLTPRLKRLLRGRPKEGTVVPSNWKKVWARIRKTAGIHEPDVCRHTFCSHALAAWGMEKTQAAMGHVPMSQTTRRHYARSVTEAAGKRFFR